RRGGLALAGGRRRRGAAAPGDGLPHPVVLRRPRGLLRHGAAQQGAKERPVRGLRLVPRGRAALLLRAGQGAHQLHHRGRRRHVRLPARLGRPGEGRPGDLGGGVGAGRDALHLHHHRRRGERVRAHGGGHLARRLRLLAPPAQVPAPGRHSLLPLRQPRRRAEELHRRRGVPDGGPGDRRGGQDRPGDLRVQDRRPGHDLRRRRRAPLRERGRLLLPRLRLPRAGGPELPAEPVGGDAGGGGGLARGRARAQPLGARGRRRRALLAPDRRLRGGAGGLGGVQRGALLR
ncbi:unnamed protein product, partial [Heterosigma akashiwo]